MGELEEPKLLEWNTINKYNYEQSKIRLFAFLDIVDEKILKCKNLVPPKITSNFEIRYEMFTRNNNSPVEKYIINLDKLERELKPIYDDLYKVLCNLTKEEKIYYSYCISSRKPEKVLPDTFPKNDKASRRIKKSCVLKLCIKFNLEVDKKF